MRPDPRPVQPSTVLALSRTLRAGSAGAAAFAAASLTAAARGALPEGRSGRRDGRFRSNKGMLLIDLNEPHHPHHDQLLNLTHTTYLRWHTGALGTLTFGSCETGDPASLPGLLSRNSQRHMCAAA